MELEIPLVSGIPFLPAPDLAGRDRIPDEGGYRCRAARPCDTVRLIRRVAAPRIGRIVRFPGGRIAALSSRWVSQPPLAPIGAIEGECLAGRGEMAVDEEVPESRIGDVFLDAPSDAGPRCLRQRGPRAAGAIGALGQPESLGVPAEDPAMLRLAESELQPDALVPRQERQKPVGGRGGDQLDAALLLEVTERPGEVPVYTIGRARASS